MKKYLGYILVGVIFVVFMVLEEYNRRNPWVCTDTQKVIEILELKQRDAILLLSNGKKHQIYLATLRVGDEICIEYKRKGFSNE